MWVQSRLGDHRAKSGFLGSRERREREGEEMWRDGGEKWSMEAPGSCRRWQEKAQN